MFLDISTIALSIASIITAYLYVRIQILANEKVFLEFQTNGLLTVIMTLKKILTSIKIQK